MLQTRTVEPGTLGLLKLLMSMEAFLNTNFDDVTIESEGASMLITNINQVKVDFVKWATPYFFPPLK